MILRLLGSRKLTRIICGVSFLLAGISLFFLPKTIPVHFFNGVPAGFGNKIEIFLFPTLSWVIACLTKNKNIKYMLTHSKVFLTDTVYQLMINGILGFVLATEMYVIYASITWNH